MRGASAFRVLWALSAALALAPLWAFRFLPMQDYPQHLFYTFALATASSAELDWSRYLEIALEPGPYSLFYALTAPLVSLVGAETAGRIVVSGYVIALAGWVGLEARDRDEPPWPLLLVFPLAFSQPYYMGFTNYLLTLPVLLFALRSHAQLLAGEGSRPGPWLTQGACIVLLFLGHLSMILVYVGLAALRVVRRSLSGRVPPAALAPFFALLILLLWVAFAPRSEELRAVDAWHVRWWPLADTVAWLALPLAGMRMNGGVRAAAVVASALAVIALAGAMLRGRGEPVAAPLRARIADERLDLAAALGAFFALPFWLAHYSYVNARLAPVVYLLGVVVLSRLHLPLWSNALVIAAVALLLSVTWTIHRESDADGREILPLIERMERGRTLHAFYPDASSRALDRLFFYQHHAHEHAYYHVLRGGGVSPSLFPTSLIPVQYRDPDAIPFARPGEPFRLNVAAGFYDYVLVRGPPARVHRSLRPAFERLGRSGAWTLYGNRRSVAR